MTDIAPYLQHESAATQQRHSTRLSYWRALSYCLFLIVPCAILLSACTTTPAITAASEDATQVNTVSYSGRLALHIEQQPPQSFSSNFQISGNTSNGSLQILSPFGSTLAMARWSSKSATLQHGSNIQQFASLDDLLTELAGAQLPVAALFDWLQGQNTAAEGWQTDLSQYSTQGKISAWRTHPLPAAKLQIILQ